MHVRWTWVGPGVLLILRRTRAGVEGCGLFHWRGVVVGRTLYWGVRVVYFDTREAMSSEDMVVSLKLQSGQVFDGIHVDNLECTLAEFIDRSLKVLEVRQSCKVIWYRIMGGC